MTIEGEQYLKNNSFSKIIINRDTISFMDGDEQMTICDIELAKELKTMNKEDQISALINYFIATNSVGGIIYGCMPIGRSTNIIISEENRALIIEGEMSLLDSEKVYAAYNQNRKNALHNIPHAKYTISSKFEGVTSFHSEDDTLEFALSHRSQQLDLDLREEEFLKEVIETLFEGEKIAYDYDREYKDGNEIFKGWYIVSEDSNMKIRLENLVFYNDILTAIIYNHNCDIEEKRKENKQLKMEEF